MYQVIVFTAEGRNVTIDLCSSKKEMLKITVRDLKKKITAKLPGDPARMMEDMKLIFADKRLEIDNKRLSDYGITDKSVIHMVITLDGGLTRLRT